VKSRFIVLSVLLAVAHHANAAPDLEALTKAAPRCDAARASCFGLSFHIAVGDSGPVATAEWITGQLAGANQHFAPLDVGFQIAAMWPQLLRLVRDKVLANLAVKP